MQIVLLHCKSNRYKTTGVSALLYGLLIMVQQRLSTVYYFARIVLTGLLLSSSFNIYLFDMPIGIRASSLLCIFGILARL